MDFEDDSSASSSSYSCSSGNAPSPVQLPPSTIITHKRKAGRKKFRETRHPFFRGVRQRNGEKWVCEVREPHKKSRIWLGTYASPEMAARAYDVAALALRGKAAPLNFPDSAWLLTRAKSSSARDIQLAALEAAETFRPVTKPVIPSTTNSSSFHACVELPSVKKVEKFPSTFLDEEALFNMPGLIASMAEGLLLTPPAMQKGFNWVDVEDEVELSLWSK